MELLSLVDTLNVCVGNPETKFIVLCEMHGGEFKAVDGILASFKDDCFPIKFEGKIYKSTVRSTECSILTEDIKYDMYKNYRVTLGHCVAANKGPLMMPYLNEQRCQAT